ncbi:MAG: hypothetical protein K2O06_18065 [Acetatifactor sp.]|nr:hypothetical protein [Acetatifactor sp.]
MTSQLKNAILYEVDKEVAQTKRVRQKLILTIKEKIKDREMWIGATKRVLCTLSVVVFCLVDQIVGSATGIVQQAWRDYTLIAIGVITLCAHRPGDFFKVPYLAWSVIFFTLKPLIFSWIRINIEDFVYLEPLSWAVWIIGLGYIRIICQYLYEKKKPEMNWPLFGVWLVMMAGMVIFGYVSDNGEIWPWRFLFAFGAFYLTNYSRKDLNMLFTSLADGMIIGFFINQGRAWMHRPYDMIRYEGMYSNCNMNALFYLVVFCAVLCKWYQAKLKKKILAIRFFYIVLAGLLTGYMIFTMSRTAVAVAAVLMVVFLVFQALSRRRHKIRELMIDGAALMLTIAICFVPAYWLARYIPAYINDPVFFETDVSAGIRALKIQKDEPVDSEKYVELEAVVKEFFGRLLWFADFASNEVSRLLRPSMVVYAAEEGVASGVDVRKIEMNILPGTDPEHPLLTDVEDWNDTWKIRQSIYEYYLKNLNIRGHSRGDRNVWITRYYHAPHAHNLYLQLAFDFGVPTGLLFVTIVFFPYYTMIKKAKEKKQGANYYLLMALVGFTTAFVLFGMLEIDWAYGQAAFSMFFVVQYLVYHNWLGKSNS